MSTQTVVIKYGGHAMDKDELNAAFADDMAFLQQSMRPLHLHLARFFRDGQSDR